MLLDVLGVKKVRRVVYEWQCVCQRCGHAWKTIRAELPVRCAKCRRPNWTRPGRPYRKK
jgi:tRNA(Ile2) C34 agmatinyltransferase TiaS